MSNTLSASVTLQINSLAQQKAAAGIRVFNLSVGEPILPPHPDIVSAVHTALAEGKTFYPPVEGVAELNRLAVDWMNSHYHCQYNVENCLPVNGGKLGLYLLLQLCIKNPDKDEVIIAAPYWVSYPSITKLFGGVPKIIDTREADGWKINLTQLKQAYTGNTKILILNNGANPTGVLYTQSELAEILAFAHEKNLLVISDEVYSGLAYDNQAYISCGSFRDYQENIVIIQSCSKNFSMTGWRVGFVFADKAIIHKLNILLGQSTSGVATISQWAAIGAFKQAEKINAWVRNTLQVRRDILIKAFKDHLNLMINPPASAIYLFISLKMLGIKANNSGEFCKQLLEKANIALVPGSAFGSEGYVRFSFGAGEDDLTGGVKALADYIQ